MTGDRYIPKLENPEPLSHPISGAPVIDNSQNFELPFNIDDLPRLSLYNLAEISQIEQPLGRRSITEKRAFSYPPIVFRSKTGVIYNDIIIKGGGAEISPNSALYDQEAYDNDRVFGTVSELNGNKVRFHFKPIKSLTSYLGVHDIKSGWLDYKMSNYLASRGLRTRELIAAWELPKDAKLSTPQGIISTAEFVEKTDVTPGLEAWAMRTKYRLHDVSRLIYEIGHIPEPDEPQITLNISKISPNDTKYVGNTEYPCHVFVDGEFNDLQLSLIQSNLSELANSISVRARLDEDSRFKQLSANHGSIESLKSAQNFYKDYLPIFAQILGEQFAVMDINNAISGMSNPQNISLLAELVDHDVTLINGKKLDNNGNFIDISPEKVALYNLLPNFEDNFIVQMRSGYYDLQRLITDLNRTGMIRFSNEEITTVLRTYIESFAKELGRVPSKYVQRSADMTKEISIIENAVEPASPDSKAEAEDIFGVNWHKTYAKILKEFLKQN